MSSIKHHPTKSVEEVSQPQISESCWSTSCTLNDTVYEFNIINGIQGCIQPECPHQSGEIGQTLESRHKCESVGEHLFDYFRWNWSLSNPAQELLAEHVYPKYPAALPDPRIWGHKGQLFPGLFLITVVRLSNMWGQEFPLMYYWHIQYTKCLWRWSFLSHIAAHAWWMSAMKLSTIAPGMTKLCGVPLVMNGGGTVSKI